MLADYNAREEVERFIFEVKKLDPEVDLEVVGYGFPVVVVTSLCYMRGCELGG
jgi:hypothetical protein